MQMQRGATANAAEAQAAQIRVVEEGGVLTHYLPTGKKKNDRYFWVSIERGTLSWDKKKNAKPNKTEPLLSVEPRPAVKDARQWFDTIDADGSGSLDVNELATLYRTARDEKLSKKELKAAMVEMDSDGSGTIEFAEFEQWWRDNGGDLEKHREQALTVVAGDTQMLLVAPDTQTRDLWARGLTATLVLQGIAVASAPAEPEPEPEPESILPAASGTEADAQPPTAAAEPTATKKARPAPVEPATAWWLEQRGGTAAVPLSPGSVEQLGVWAKVHSPEALPQQPQPEPAPANSSTDGQSSTTATQPRKSHDGYGALPVKAHDPITHPKVDSTGAPISLVPTAAAAGGPPPASPAGGSAVATEPTRVKGPPITADRHHAQDSTHGAVVSCWRPAEDSVAVESQSSVASQSVAEASAATTFDARLRASHVTETERSECFDPASNHHPEGHWHQVKQEGEFSAHLSAHFLSRDVTSGALYVDTDGTGGSITSAAISSSPSSGLHPVVEVERTLAGFVDHGRGCHAPKYLDSPHDKDNHGVNGHEKGHRPLPWDQHAGATPAGLKPYQKSHQKGTLHGHHVGDHGVKSSPKPRLPHHQKLLRSRDLRDPLAVASGGGGGTATHSAADRSGRSSSPGSDATLHSTAYTESALGREEAAAGLAFAPG